MLESNCNQYEEYASDKEEKEIIGTTQLQIGSFLKTVSVKQGEEVDKKINRLKVLYKDYEMALNKDVIKKEAFKVISDIERLLAKQSETVEQGWKSLEKKAQHFHSFDVSYKLQKRQSLQTECETLSAQIKDNISTLLTLILDKLDSRISPNDQQEMKKVQHEAEEFQKEIQRYLNGNTELSRQLGEIKKTIPSSEIDFKAKEITSVKEPLESMKTFGAKLKTNQLRMITIKDKIQIMRNQVESVQEMPEQPAEETKVEPKTAYDAVEDDAIDQLVKKYLADIEITISVKRIQEAVY